jgi:hypothetical protein
MTRRKRQNDGRIKRVARQALASGGGKTSTSQVLAHAYEDHAIVGREVNWGRLRNVRRALLDVGATPIGRSKERPGRPLIWEARHVR